MVVRFFPAATAAEPLPDSDGDDLLGYEQTFVPGGKATDPGTPDPAACGVPADATFLGWYQRGSNGGLVHYEFDNPVSLDLNLYANWQYTLVTYSVTYDANGATEGAAPTDAAGYLPGAQVPVQDGSGLGKNGSVFLGWRPSTGGSLVQGGGRVTMGNANLTFTAVYSAPTVSANIVFHSNIPDADTTVFWSGVAGASIKWTGAANLGFSRADYTFLGWNTDPNATTPEAVYTPGTVSVLGKDLELYAVWLRNDVEIPVRKEWDHTGAPASERPGSVTIRLLRDGTQYGSPLALSAANGWQGKFVVSGRDGAPMPGKVDGSKTLQAKKGSLDFGTVSFTRPGIYVYDIAETAGTTEGFAYDPATYVMTITVTDIAGTLSAAAKVEASGAPAPERVVFTNAYTIPTRDKAVTKVWNDNDNALGVRPSSVRIQLERTPEGGAKEDVPGAAATLNAGNNWANTFVQQGKQYTYSVRELDLNPNYTAGYKAEGNNLTVTNSIQTIEKLTLEKEWDIQGTGFTKEAVKFELWRRGANAADAKVGEYTLEAANAVDGNEDLWTLGVTGWPRYDSRGGEFTYYVKEPVPQFATTRKESGLRVTNTYGTDQQITVTKEWDYTGAPADQRPDSVEIELLRDGVVYDTATVRGSHTFAVPQNDYQKESGIYTFTVREKTADARYQASYSGDAANGFVVKNTYIRPTFTMEGIKTWKGVPAGVTVPAVTVNLWRSDDTLEPWRTTTIASGQSGHAGKRLP